MQQQGVSALREKIGVESTGFVFNSPEALVLQASRPGNPMVDAGAIAAVSLLQPSPEQTRAQTLQLGISAFAGQRLPVLGEAYQSAIAHAQDKRALTALLAKYGRLYSEGDEAVDAYTQ